MIKEEGIKCYGYLIFPEEGIIKSLLTGKEIAKGKDKLVIELDSGKRSRIKKIRAVYESVNGTIPKGAVLRAKDGNEINAKIDNIEVINRREYFKDHNWQMKCCFSPEQVEAIRKDYESGKYSYNTLAKKWACSKSTIQKIIKRTYFYDKEENINCGTTAIDAGGKWMWQETDNGRSECKI